MPDDYIKRSDALKVLCDKCVFESHCSRKNEFCDQIQGIKAIPAADVEPVRNGSWIWDDEGFHCSECWFHAYGDTGEVLSGHYHYCPNCGAKMDEEEDDGNEL